MFVKRCRRRATDLGDSLSRAVTRAQARLATQIGMCPDPGQTSPLEEFRYRSALIIAMFDQ